MKKTGRKILSLIMTILVLGSMCTAACAEAAPAEETAAAAPGDAAALPAAEDSGIIDANELQQWMDSFVQEHNLNQNYMRFSVGFWYSGTGDSWYYDADQWMYSASLYKVPVSMLMAEKEAAGELTQDSVVNGTTLEYLESTALIYSNNDSGHSMVSWLGGTYSGKCSDMTIKFTDLPESYFEQDFYDVSYYTARYMTQVMSTLYQGGDAAFPHVLDYLKQAQPDDYYNRNPALKGSYTIAQKFGAYEEGNGNNNNHCAAVIYTPNPIVVTVMTRNIGDYQSIIAEVGGHLADYALQLDQNLESWKQAQAEQAAAELAAAELAAAQQEAGANGTAEAAEPETQSSDTVTPVPAETNPVSVPAQTEESQVPVQDTAARPASQKRIPTAVLIIAGVLVAVLIIAAVLLVAMRRRADQEPDEEAFDWQDARPVETAQTRKRRAERRDEDRHTETAKRRSASAAKSSGKNESDGGYKPRH
jgi:hypothetical protein